MTITYTDRLGHWGFPAPSMERMIARLWAKKAVPEGHSRMPSLLPLPKAPVPGESR
ncbi:hypothetical protein PsAD5_03084 [Pseudovibrio sp. Ad5]|uniref:hypothetical protein n=1 Tax=Pseudovibrio sp. Ad5 TaxID=989436 RepID=UPI0007B20487|nr:hypothetical protein [Pseudovibrio sp. Ad5]KZK93369.1 hypothetical protein PsAD5_03084 [Pseudovibrio sp. Ad5]